MKSEVYTKEFVVPASAIDDLHHVNNLVYLNWCLEAAEEHWLTNTTPKIREAYVWVVMNHSINYRNPSFQGDHLVVETRISSYSGARSEREYRIFRPKDGKTIVDAKSLWCFLDAKTHKPTLIPEEISSLF